MQSTLRRPLIAGLISHDLLNVSSRRGPRRTQLGRKEIAGCCRRLSSGFQHPPRIALAQSPTSHQQWSHSHGDASSDTIYALSTPPGRAAIAIIRISGAACLQIYRALCPGQRLPPPRVAIVRKLLEPVSATAASRILDSGALLLYFPAPNTATGEDVLELHTHGGPAIIRAVLKAIPCTAAPNENCQTYRIRYAEPGEFTKRAFYNDRLDLAQIEALSDSLSAETEQQRRLAIQGTSCSLVTRYENWRHLLLGARAELEALIDFSEDQEFDDSPEQLIASVSEQVRHLKKEVTLHVENASRGELLRSGISIALLGAPNSGKSSLLNIIVGREAAIVSAEEGTTRDIVDVNVDIGGWLCRLGDMAGLRKGNSKPSSDHPSNPVGIVEREGIRRAKERALASDVVIVVLSLKKPKDGSRPSLIVDPELVTTVRECAAAAKSIIVVVNKTDHLPGGVTQQSRTELYGETAGLFPFVPEAHVFGISCLETCDRQAVGRDPGNMQEFLQGLQTLFSTMTSASGTAEAAVDKSYWEESLSVSHRQSGHLQQCLGHLARFLSFTDSAGQSSTGDQAVSEFDLAAAAEHLRFAGDCLAKITGKGASGEVEEVLGIVFEK